MKPRKGAKKAATPPRGGDGPAAAFRQPRRVGDAVRSRPQPLCPPPTANAPRRRRSIQTDGGRVAAGRGADLILGGPYTMCDPAPVHARPAAPFCWSAVF